MTDYQDPSPRLRVSDCPALSMCEKIGITNRYCRKSLPLDYDDGICKLDHLLHGRKTEERSDEAI